VPSGPPDATPSPDEDRLANRLELAARLLALLRSHGLDVDAEAARLRAARAAFASGDRAGATERTESLLADLGERASSWSAGPSART
jgi:hypothetical protein